MSITIYHNPRRSKSRQTLEIVKKHGHEPEILEVLKSPPRPLPHFSEGWVWNPVF